MERTEEALRERVRETPLNERLKACEEYIASMCAERRPPKMTIPLQHYDEDFYIYTTLADAQATIAALQAQVKELERDPYKQGFIDALEKVASDWASKEFRGHDEIQSCEVQAFLDTRHVHYEECRGVKPLQSQLTQRTAELEAATRERDEAAKDRDDWITSWRALQRHNERIEAELERVRGELATYKETKHDAI